MFPIQMENLTTTMPTAILEKYKNWNITTKYETKAAENPIKTILATISLLM